MQIIKDEAKEVQSMGTHGRLPESELDIMLVIWSKGGGVTAPAILEALERPLTASALHSYLKRLEEKGFLRCQKEGKTNRYTPLVSRAEYQHSEGRSILDKLYGGSLSRFAAALYDGGPVEREELQALQELLDSLREGGS